MTNNVHYIFSDNLGSTSLVTDALGTMASCNGYTSGQFESDYYPYGGEMSICNNLGDQNYKFTGKERDAESGLDNFGKRYDASSLGRFMTPDAFFKDSHVGDPQSWNEYAYVRNNPLRYVDPNGETATISSTCTTDANNHTTCNVNISASIAIYAVPGSGLTQDQLNSAASTIKDSIQSAWSGSVTQDGVTYNVSTQVSVQVTGSQADATKSGAQNVVGLSNGPADAAHKANALTGPGTSFGNVIRGQDVGVWNYNTLGTNALNTAAHEFTHLLGVDDKPGYVLSNTDPAWEPHHATPSDLGWGIREAVSAVRFHLNSVQNEQSLGWPTPNPFTRTETVGAPIIGWWK